MKKTITFGIIVYNVEKYLRSCLESVMRQKGDDIEIIIVNDGSTDSSPSICNEMAKKDSRIKVINKENGGTSSARNRIIDEAAGEWISFVDGDDMVTDDAADIMREYISDEYQIIYFDAVYFRDEKNILAYNIDMPPLYISSEEAIRQLMSDCIMKTKTSPNYINKNATSVWGKIYKTAFIRENNIKFDLRARKSQDTIFNFCCMKYIKNTVMIRKAAYYYRLNQDSMIKKYNVKIKEFNDNIMIAYKELIDEIDGDLKDEFMKKYYCLGIMNIKVASELYFCRRENKKPYKEREKEFFDYISQEHYACAIENVDSSVLFSTDKLIYDCIKNKDFKGICRYVEKKEMDAKMRLCANKLGLNKIKRKLVSLEKR